MVYSTGSTVPTKSVAGTKVNVPLALSVSIPALATVLPSLSLPDTGVAVPTTIVVPPCFASVTLISSPSGSLSLLKILPLRLTFFLVVALSLIATGGLFAPGL